jgi:acyl-CoA thioester hydrolase
VESITPIRVRYAETDAMGIVHHAVYPVWMELGRSDLLREMGQSYAAWEKRGVLMSVAELHVRYRAPARYDEMVEVHSVVKEAGRRKVVFSYTVLRDGVRLAEGESVHLVTGPDGRSRVMPDDLLQFISGALQEPSPRRIGASAARQESSSVDRP